MSEFTFWDLEKGKETNNKVNFTGEYKPKSFWEVYGDYYHRTFSIHGDNKIDGFDLNVPGLLGRLERLPSKRVLEVGCGFGRVMSYIMRNLPKVEEVVGIEHSSTMIKKSKAWFDDLKFTKEEKSKIKIINARAQELPFPDKSFDIIYTHVCLTHIPPEDIEQVTKEISRVTRNWIIHIERFAYLYEHPQQHRWSHLLPSFYTKLGWKIHEYDTINEGHDTRVLTLKRVK